MTLGGLINLRMAVVEQWKGGCREELGLENGGERERAERLRLNAG